MNIPHHKIIFNAVVRQGGDDTSLEFGRDIVLGLYAEDDLYTRIDSLTLVCDRGEIACECYEFTLPFLLLGIMYRLCASPLSRLKLRVVVERLQAKFGNLSGHRTISTIHSKQ